MLMEAAVNAPPISDFDVSDADHSWGGTGEGE